MSAVIKQDFSSKEEIDYFSREVSLKETTSTDDLSKREITKISAQGPDLDLLKKIGKEIPQNNYQSKKPIHLTPYDNLVLFLPGVSNLIYAPYLFFKGLITSTDNCKKLDSENSLISKLRILQAPISFFHAIGSFLENFIIFFSVIISKISVTALFRSSLAKITYCLGLLVTTIEAIIEITGFVKSLNFSSKPIFSIQGFIKKLKHNPSIADQKNIIEKHIQYLNKNKQRLEKKLGKTHFQNLLKILLFYRKELYRCPSSCDIEKLETQLLYLFLDNFKQRELEPNPETVLKISQSNPHISEEKAKQLSEQLNLENLSKRIHLFGATKVKNDLDTILTSLNTSDPSLRKNAIEEANKLINFMKTQNSKKIVVHIIGLVAIGLTLVGLILSTIFVFHPLLLPAIIVFVLPEVLFWTGFAISIVHFCLNRGFMGCEGWHFSIRKTLPEMPRCLKNAFQNVKRKFSKKTNPLQAQRASYLKLESFI